MPERPFYSYSVMCIVCYATHDSGEGWDTINLGNNAYHRCAQCAAENRRPVTASTAGETDA